MRFRDRGAALVEAAIIIPLLVLMALGIVDTSWLLSEQLEVRGAAREGGRYAATVSGDTSFVVSHVCQQFEPGDTVTVSLSGASGGLGDELELTVSRQTETITGFLDYFFGSPVTLSSTSTFRIERLPVTWTDATNVGCP